MEIKIALEGRIPDVIQFNKSWAIPADTVKPTRTVKSKPGPKKKTEKKQEAVE